MFVLVGTIITVSLIQSGAVDHMTMAFDDNVYDGPMIAAAAGVLTTVALAVAGMIVFAVLTWVAILVPLVLALAFLGILCAVVLGVAPLLVPVLLVVGACVLLSRWAKRRRARADSAASAVPLPASSAQ